MLSNQPDDVLVSPGQDFTILVPRRAVPVDFSVGQGLGVPQVAVSIRLHGRPVELWTAICLLHVGRR